MTDDWGSLFEDEFEDDEEIVNETEEIRSEKEDEPENDHDYERRSSYGNDDYEDEEDDDEPDEFDDNEDEDDELKSRKNKPSKAGRFGKKQKPEKETKTKSVHGLKRKDTAEKEVRHSSSGTGKVVPIIVGVIVIGFAVAGVGYIANKQVHSANETNQNLTKQIENRTRYVYTAKRDLKAGDEIILSGTDANVELSQIYTSLDESSYIDDSVGGYLQVDVKAGLPIMANEVGDTNPETVVSNAVEEAVSVYKKARVMPYKITADFIDLSTGNALAESRDLLLDDGANEKAFNTEAETIDGYILKSIQVDGDGVHAYGISEKSMKQGIVSMYYYTTKGGWGRHEIKGNIRVQYGYVKKADNQDTEEISDVFDDSAWIPDDEVTEETTDTTATDGADTAIDSAGASDGWSTDNTISEEIDGGAEASSTDTSPDYDETVSDDTLVDENFAE